MLTPSYPPFLGLILKPNKCEFLQKYLPIPISQISTNSGTACTTLKKCLACLRHLSALTSIMYEQCQGQGQVSNLLAACVLLNLQNWMTLDELPGK